MNILKILIGLILFSSIYSPSVSAALIGSTTWVIKPGDTLYKISRDIFPGNKAKQSQLRKALIKNNPNAFKNGASVISFGDKLKLPKFAIKTSKPAPTPTPVIVKKAAPQKTIKTIQAFTPKPKKIVNPIKKIMPKPTQNIIGSVVINVGELSAENNGKKRTLNRRSDIYRGDTLSTGGKSHTQIRLKDGALLSLRPFTNMKIVDYQYNGIEDGTEKSILELVKGGFRTITGAIGHKNKKAYQVRTNVATIGIRGTHYSLVLCQQQSCNSAGSQAKDGLYGGVADGSIVIENKSGIHQFNNDQFFQVASINAKPVEFLQPPAILKNNPMPIGKAPKNKNMLVL